MNILLFLILLGGLLLTGLAIYLLMVFHILYMGLFVVVLLGGLFVTGFFVDLVAKKKKIEMMNRDGSHASSDA